MYFLFNGFPGFGDVQVAVDATLVSPVRRDGTVLAAELRLPSKLLRIVLRRCLCICARLPPRAPRSFMVLPVAPDDRGTAAPAAHARKLCKRQVYPELRNARLPLSCVWG